jgi:hypothetical protein
MKNLVYFRQVIKANLTDSFKAIVSNRLQKGLTKGVRLYFMFAWLHAIIQER